VRLRLFQRCVETFAGSAQVSTGMRPESLLFALTFSAIMIVGFALASRYKQRELQHRERMAAIEKGLPLPPLYEPRPPRPMAQTYVLRGLMWLFSGIAIAIFLLGVSLTAQHEVPASVRVYDATRAKANGATEEQIRAIMNEHQQNGMPPAVSLIGLIPLGIGLAYLITYRVEREGRAS
jgi:hypothetical protein